MTASAISHPLRRAILLHLSGVPEAAPSDIAEALDEPLGNVSYHVGILQGMQAIYESRTEPVRGTIKHYYKAKFKLCVCCGGSGVHEVVGMVRNNG